MKEPVHIKRYLLSLPEVEESYPFYPEVLVPKILGKMFATYSSHNNRWQINLKCDPDEALMLRDIFPEVVAGYHMNKRHWNTVYLDGDLAEKEIFRMIDNSYLLVVKSCPKKVREGLKIRAADAEIFRA